MLLILNLHSAVYKTAGSQNKFATCVKKSALREIYRRLSSMTFNSSKNWFWSALLKNRIITKQQCSQKRSSIVGVSDTLKRFSSARIFYFCFLFSNFVSRGNRNAIECSYSRIFVVSSYITVTAVYLYVIKILYLQLYLYFYCEFMSYCANRSVTSGRYYRDKKIAV